MGSSSPARPSAHSLHHGAFDPSYQPLLATGRVPRYFKNCCSHAHPKKSSCQSPRSIPSYLTYCQPVQSIGENCPKTTSHSSKKKQPPVFLAVWFPRRPLLRDLTVQNNGRMKNSNGQERSHRGSVLDLKMSSDSDRHNKLIAAFQKVGVC